MQTLAFLKEKSRNLPILPGVYIMKSCDLKVIYIGKAKSLRDRVSQYFRLDLDVIGKTEKMVLSVNDFSYIVTSSEFEALVLECSLIKKYKPKYNILLKDDKGYSYVKITKEYWPRLTFSKKNSKGDKVCKYLGPYTSSFSVKKSLDEARKIFKLPVCNRKFFDKDDENLWRTKRLKPCLYYHINQCAAPCCGKISHEDYVDSVNEAINFLEGLDYECMKDLNCKMNIASRNLDFEKAAKLRDKIFALKQMKKRQNVVSVKVKNQDVIALFPGGDVTCFEILKVREGLLLDKETFFLKHIEELNFAREEFIQQYYQGDKFVPPRITLDAEIDGIEMISKWLSLKFNKKILVSVAKRGEQLNLVKLCQSNARASFFEEFKSKNNISITRKLERFLNLNVPPKYIESYDISNMANENNVGGMVVFEDGKPLRSNYKKFKIDLKIYKNEGDFTCKQNDYASMCQMIDRRFNEYEKSNSQNGFERLPDLIFLDGGKGHVSSVEKLLKKRGYELIRVFGMSKDKKHKTSMLTTSKNEINIKEDREIFLFICRIQEEVHRFTIGYHRSRRKNKIKSSILSVPNVGEKRAKMLLAKFGSLENIKKAKTSELELIPGVTSKIARDILNFLMN
ncbi:MAG: excinuclease ABC subunit UvrC [Oscillospiraceae bacterium]|nr:excinuclease ABC subunit UvrC [Oscillospiraceae bacterium]